MYNTHLLFERGTAVKTVRTYSTFYSSLKENDTYSATRGSRRRTKMRCVQTDMFRGSASSCDGCCCCTGHSSDVDICRTVSTSWLRRLLLDVDVVATIDNTSHHALHNIIPMYNGTHNARKFSDSTSVRSNWSRPHNKYSLLYLYWNRMNMIKLFLKIELHRVLELELDE